MSVLLIQSKMVSCNWSWPLSSFKVERTEHLLICTKLADRHSSVWSILMVPKVALLISSRHWVDNSDAVFPRSSISEETSTTSLCVILIWARAKVSPKQFQGSVSLSYLHTSRETIQTVEAGWVLLWETVLKTENEGRIWKTGIYPIRPYICYNGTLFGLGCMKQ